MEIRRHSRALLERLRTAIQWLIREIISQKYYQKKNIHGEPPSAIVTIVLFIVPNN